jgi:hypothetical protein
MIGSLRELWEQAVYQKNPVTEMLDFSMPRTLTASDILISVLLILAGFVVVSLLDHVSGGSNPVIKRIWARA